MFSLQKATMLYDLPDHILQIIVKYIASQQHHPEWSQALYSLSRVSTRMHDLCVQHLGYRDIHFSTYEDYLKWLEIWASDLQDHTTDPELEFMRHVGYVYLQKRTFRL